jgi:hypothetical protein
VYHLLNANFSLYSIFVYVIIFLFTQQTPGKNFVRYGNYTVEENGKTFAKARTLFSIFGE